MKNTPQWMRLSKNPNREVSSVHKVAAPARGQKYRVTVTKDDRHGGRQSKDYHARTKKRAERIEAREDEYAEKRNNSSWI